MIRFNPDKTDSQKPGRLVVLGSRTPALSALSKSLGLNCWKAEEKKLSKSSNTHIIAEKSELIAEKEKKLQELISSKGKTNVVLICKLVDEINKISH